MSTRIHDLFDLTPQIAPNMREDRWSRIRSSTKRVVLCKQKIDDDDDNDNNNNNTFGWKWAWTTTMTTRVIVCNHTFKNSQPLGK